MPSFQPSVVTIGTTRLPARGSVAHQLGEPVAATLRWSAEERAVGANSPRRAVLRGCWLSEGSRMAALTPALLRVRGAAQHSAWGSTGCLTSTFNCPEAHRRRPRLFSQGRRGRPALRSSKGGMRWH